MHRVPFWGPGDCGLRRAALEGRSGAEKVSVGCAGSGTGSKGLGFAAFQREDDIACIQIRAFPGLRIETWGIRRRGEWREGQDWMPFGLVVSHPGAMEPRKDGAPGVVRIGMYERQQRIVRLPFLRITVIATASLMMVWGAAAS